MNIEPLRQRARALAPKSIVARAAALILGMSLLLSAVFVAGASLVIQRYETERLHTELEDLLATVEHTVSIACFVKDSQLASEIALGLRHSKLVTGLRIVADQEVLLDQLAPLPPADAIVLARPVISPFVKGEVIGHISLQASRPALQAQAWTYTRAILLLLGAQALLVASGVAWIVLQLITKPIKSISDELHKLELRTGMQLRVPRVNREDEIGRLVLDVNSMISQLSSLVDTERQLRQEQERSERRLSLIFEKADTGIFVVDQDGLLRSWNPAFARMLPGVAAGETRLPALLAPHAERAEQLMRRAAAEPEGADDEFELSSEGADSRWLKASLDPIDSDQLEGVLNDISSHKRAEAEARLLASRDPLTGLLNRRGFQAQLAARQVYPVTNPDTTTALLMIDLDYFKQVNDSHGHAAGDQVLLRVSDLLQQAVRRSDLVARIGGDEFVIALVGIDSVATAETIAGNIIVAVRQPMRISAEISAQIGASIGLAIVSRDDASLEAALERADQALYAVKQAGRGRVLLAPDPAPAPSGAGIALAG